MSINNFTQISSMMDFSLPNTMYFIQILKRRKDNPEMETGVKVLNNYYIHSHEDMTKYKDLIMDECHEKNARAYFNPNRLNTVNIALNTLKVIVDDLLITQKTNNGKWVIPNSVVGEFDIYNEIQSAIKLISNNIGESEHFYRIRKAYSTACGTHHSEPRKKWVVDIDTTNDIEIQNITNFINGLYVEAKSTNKILMTIPTKNGIHLICEGFNMKKFADAFPGVTVAKNSPTILYIA